MLVKAFNKFVEDNNAVLLIFGSVRKGVSEPIVKEMEKYFSERIIWYAY